MRSDGRGLGESGFGWGVILRFGISDLSTLRLDSGQASLRPQASWKTAFAVIGDFP